MASFDRDVEAAANITNKEDPYREKRKAMKDQITQNLKKAGKPSDDAIVESILNKIEENLKKKNKTILDYEKKSAKEIRDEEYENKMVILKLEKDSATSRVEKLNANAKMFGATIKKAAVETSEKLLNGALNLGKFFDAGVKEYANMYGQYSAKINARLQTFDNQGGEAFDNLSKLVRKNLAASPYLKQQEMLQNLDSLISQGISYNVEQRAFLAAMTDKVVTTFSAIDTTLLRMVRLQQMDTTQARMGMEAQLTQYFNSTYEDTSYLNNLYDTVTENLFEASSQLGRNASVELEYVVQKWLGSMSSVGVGDTFITNVSQGLGYLGSGNVDALSSNEALQNLFVMAANRSGVEYSKILSQGLNSETANRLLSGIASYVKEISQNDNKVIKSQYAQLFGMSLSDMTAMLNLQVEDLTNISKDMKVYGDLVNELNSQLNQVSSRMHISQQIETAFSNFMTGVAGGIAESTGQYVTWKVADFLDQVVGGIAIPTISVFGSSIDLNTSVAGLIKTGIAGYNVLDQISNIFQGLSSGGSLNLNAWAGEESTSRGSGFKATTTGGYSSTTSTSVYIGNSNSSEIYNSSVTAAKEQAAEEYKGTEEEEEDILDLTKVIIEILRGWDSPGGGVKIDNMIPLNVNVSNDGFGSGLSTT